MNNRLRAMWRTARHQVSETFFWLLCFPMHWLLSILQNFERIIKSGSDAEFLWLIATMLVAAYLTLMFSIKWLLWLFLAS